MYYTVDLIIEKPLDEVVKLFLNRENYKHWMDGLVSVEPVSGIQGEVGAKSTFRFKLNNRELEMNEEVLTVNLPNEYSVSYSTKEVFNIVTNRFEKVSEAHTRCITETDFKFSGAMKFFAPFMKGAFKKQSLKYLKDFKTFAENS